MNTAMTPATACGARVVATSDKWERGAIPTPAQRLESRGVIAMTSLQR